MNLDNLLLSLPRCGCTCTNFHLVEDSNNQLDSRRLETHVQNRPQYPGGCHGFLRAEYRILIIFVVAVAALLYWSGSNNEQSHALVAVSFAVGAFCSGLGWLLGHEGCHQGKC